MELLLLLGIGVAAGVGLLLIDNDNSDPVTTDGTDPDEPVGAFQIHDDGSVVGTDGNDSLGLSDLTDGAFDLMVSAGGGDDLIDLSDPSAGGDLTASPIVADEIGGGDGNDTIVANVWEGQISGGDGDDQIRVGSADTNGLVVDGGQGDDLIDGLAVEDGRLLGGEGNDTIIAKGFGDTAGTGYVSQADGGVGADHIIYHIESDFGDHGFDGMEASGGAGADRFEVHVNEGELQVPKDPEVNRNSHLTIVDPNTWQLDTLVIEDFEPGVDTLSLEVATLNDTYELTSVELESLEDEDMSCVMLTYESASEPTRIVNINLGAAGVSWDYVELAGEAFELVKEEGVEACL